MIIGFARALERDARQRVDIGRKRWREYRIAFDNTGITIGRLLAEAGPVYQRNRQPAFREVDRHRNADNTCAKNNRIGACHGRLGLLLRQPMSFIWIVSGSRAMTRAVPETLC